MCTTTYMTQIKSFYTSAHVKRVKSKTTIIVLSKKKKKKNALSKILKEDIQLQHQQFRQDRIKLRCVIELGA